MQMLKSAFTQPQAIAGGLAFLLMRRQCSVSRWGRIMRLDKERRLRIEAWILGGLMLITAARALTWLFT